jgi:[ribosomal protein S5]-alanine N-acetyltransferase
METGRIICESSRLVLRQFTLDDLEPLAAMHSDTEVCRFIGGVKTLQQSRENLEQWIAEYQKYGVSKWAVVLRSTEEFIGRCGMTLEQIEGVAEWELGWTFARRFWGKGYATEAALAAMNYWFRVLQKPRLTSLVHPLNVASVRVATRLGMTLDRTVQWHGSETNLYVASAQNR